MSCGCDCIDTNDKVKVSITDTEGFLAAKIQAGPGITVSTGGVPGAEFMVIENNCCDFEDKFVAVAPGCTPGYLEDQIIPAVGSAITVTQVGCKVVIGLDGPTLAALDKFVAVDGGCPAGFLEGQIVGSGSPTGTGSGILVTKVGCTLKVTIDESAERRDMPGATLKLTSSILFTVNALSNGFINSNGLFGGTIAPTVFGPWTAEPNSDAAMITTPGVITAIKTGWHVVGFGSNCDFNRGTQAIRMFLGGTGAGILRLDQKFSGGNLPSGANPGNPTAGNGSGSGLNGANGGTVGYGQPGIYWMNAGDTVFLSLRIDASVDASISSGDASNVRVIGQNGSVFTPDVSGTGLTGTFFYCKYAGNIVG